MSHNATGTEYDGLLVKVSANVKQLDFFSLAPLAPANDDCSLFVGSKRIDEALSKRIV